MKSLFQKSVAIQVVSLSKAKNPSTTAQDRSDRLRPFTEFILSEAEGLRVT